MANSEELQTFRRIAFERLPGLFVVGGGRFVLNS